MTLIRPLAALAVASLLSGCLSTKSYVDPKLHDLSWTAVRAPAQVHAVGLEVQFFRNGERMARVDKHARGAVERALQKSGVVSLQASGAPAKLQVSVNNVADIGDAMKKGFGTGLTFGAKGSVVTDGYEITVRYERDGQVVEKRYQHALHTTVGNADPVTPATPMTPVQGFDAIVEDALMHFLRDAQADGLLVLRTSVRTNRA